MKCLPFHLPSLRRAFGQLVPHRGGRADAPPEGTEGRFLRDRGYHGLDTLEVDAEEGRLGPMRSSISETMGHVQPVKSNPLARHRIDVAPAVMSLLFLGWALGYWVFLLIAAPERLGTEGFAAEFAPLLREVRRVLARPLLALCARSISDHTVAWGAIAGCLLCGCGAGLLALLLARRCPALVRMRKRSIRYRLWRQRLGHWLLWIRIMALRQRTVLGHSALGVFLLQRLLPVLDLVLDAWATFCHKDLLLCTHTGPWWTDHWWRAHMGAFAIGSTFVLRSVLAGPMFLRRFPLVLSILGWAVFGIPVSLLLDVLMLACFPFAEPRMGWLANAFRLQRLAPALVEAPLQLLLQCWMLLEELLLGDSELLLLVGLSISILTSLLTLGFCIHEIKVLAAAEGGSFATCLSERLLAGLERDAPGLQGIRTEAEVDYSEYGPLTQKHTRQIAGALRSTQCLRDLYFPMGSRLGLEACVALLAAALSPLRAEALQLEVQEQLAYGGEACGLEISSEMWTRGSGSHDTRLQVNECCKRLATAIRECTHIQALLLGEPRNVSTEVAFTLLSAAVSPLHQPLDVEVPGQLCYTSSKQELFIWENLRIGSEGCFQILCVPGLLRLCIGDHNEIGLEGCQILQTLQQLKELRIGRSNDIGAAGCSCLKELSQLIELYIGSGNNIGTEGCKHISLMRNLRKVTLGGYNDLDASAKDLLLELESSGCQVVIVGAVVS